MLSKCSSFDQSPILAPNLPQETQELHCKALSGLPVLVVRHMLVSSCFDSSSRSVLRSFINDHR